MNWKNYLTTAATSIFSWRLVAKEGVGVIMVWGGYLITKVMLQEPGIKDALPDWGVTFTANLFWPTVVVSAISLALASLKSALPAALAWLTIVPLYLMGFAEAAKIALVIATASIVLYTIGFAFHGGRLRVNTHN